MDSPTSRRDEISSEIRDRAYNICCEHLGGAWNDISPDEMSIAPVTGGMSNFLYSCSLPESTKLLNGEPNQALLRLYGDQSRTSDMSLQVQIFELLSSKDLGPKLYGNFDDGRLEEFLPAQSLTSDEMMDQEISSIIARKLAVVHCLEVPNMSKDDNWLLSKFREWSEFINNHRRSPSDYSDSMAHDSTLKIANKLLAIDFEQEINRVHKIIEGTRSPIVFSHNDLHQGNILLTKPTKRRSVLENRVILIDFEYCSYNYRAYDIANHFCEWCFEYDTPDYPHFALFEDRFPSVEEQRKFIRTYLDQQRKYKLMRELSEHQTGLGPPKVFNTNGHALNGGCSADQRSSSRPHINNGNCAKHYYDHENNNNNNNHCDNNLQCRKNGHVKSAENLMASSCEVPVSDAEVDKILREIKPFCMVANLVWTLWCIQCAYNSNIKFGFWEHAWSRWQLYLRWRSHFVHRGHRLYQEGRGEQHLSNELTRIPANLNHGIPSSHDLTI